MIYLYSTLVILCLATLIYCRVGDTWIQMNASDSIGKFLRFTITLISKTFNKFDVVKGKTLYFCM